MADEPSMAEVLARLQELELAEARRQAATAPVTMTDTSHHPRPGTWVGDSNEAQCRYCGNVIHQDPADSDTPGQWRYVRDLFCAARASGAEARD